MRKFLRKLFDRKHVIVWFYSERAQYYLSNQTGENSAWVRDKVLALTFPSKREAWEAFAALAAVELSPAQCMNYSVERA